MAVLMLLSAEQDQLRNLSSSKHEHGPALMLSTWTDAVLQVQQAQAHHSFEA